MSSVWQQYRNRATRRAEGDAGMTLVELVIAIVLLAGITAGIAAAFSLTVKTSGSAADRIKKSNDAEVISNFLVRDAASAGAFGVDNKAVVDAGGLGLAPGVTIATASSDFCADSGASPVVRFEWIERTASATTSTRVAANYGQVGNTLVRRGCTQSFDLRTGVAIGAPAVSSATIARQVAAGGATAECSPGCTPSYRTPDSVTLTVRSTTVNDDPSSAYVFSVTGSLRVGQLTSDTSGGPSEQVLALLALGAETAPCPAPAVPRASGLALNGAADRLKIYGVAAVDSTSTAACGPALVLNGQITATETLSLTGANCTGSGCTTGNPRRMGAPIPDPYRGLTPPANASSCNPSLTNPGQVAPNTLGPGVYHRQLDLTQLFSTTYFQPGIYILCNGMVAGQNFQLSTVPAGANQAGALFYLAGGTMNIDPSAQVALQGMASGPYQDMLIWQSRTTAQGGDISISTGVDFLFFAFNSSYNGVIYAPDAQVRIVDGIHIIGLRQLEATVRAVVARNVYIGGAASWGPRDARVRMGPGPATTTALTLSKNPFNLGESVTMTAQVTRVAPSTAAEDGPITGSVTFLSDGAPIANSNVTLDASGRAQFTTTDLEGGTHAITAAYGGDGTYSSSISPPIGTTVVRVTPTVVLTDLLEPSGVGQAASFRVVVTGPPAAPVPTGTVTLYEGTAVVGSGTLVGQTGTVVINTTTLTEGTHTLRATYEGNANYFAANSNSVVHHVRRAVTVTLDGSPLANTTVGQSLTLTATVNMVQNLNPPPSGTVTFYDGDAEIASNVSLSGSTASLSTNGLARGAHALTARYNGDAQWGAALSNTLSRTVDQATPIVTLTYVGGPNRSFTVAVAGVPGAPIPTGEVRIFRGTSNPQQVGSEQLTNGTASVDTSLPMGQSTVFARYMSDGNYLQADSATQSVNIQRTVTLTRTQPGSPPVGDVSYGTTLDFEATVSPTPTGGLVRLYRSFNNGAESVYDSDSSVTSGTATFDSMANLAAGTWRFRAEYRSSNFNPNEIVSSDVYVQVVVGSTTQTQVFLDDPGGDATVEYGEYFPVSARVLPNPGGGTVVFSNGTSQWSDSLNQQALANVNARHLALGSQTVAASFQGNSGYNGSTSVSNVTQTVVAANTLLGISRAPSAIPSDVGQAVTFQAQVTAPASSMTPTGSVTFRYANNAPIPEYPNPVALDGNGRASITLTFGSPVTNLQIVATYSSLADGFFATSSNSITHSAAVPRPRAIAIDSVATGSGSSSGRPSVGDQIIYTYDQGIATTAIISTWTTGTQTVRVRFCRASNGSNVFLTVFSSGTPQCNTSANLSNLGSVDLDSNNYVNSGNTGVVVDGTLVRSTSGSNTIFTLTFGTINNPQNIFGSDSGNNRLTWAPSTAASNANGNVQAGSVQQATAKRTF